MKNLTVGFYGTYIPLQGVEHIIDAAADPRCRELTFTLIGKGQTYAMVREYAEKKGVTNVNFFPRVSYDELRHMMAQFDIALGIFGGTEKAARVIPNKVYDAIAFGLPVITADTRAIREVFTDGLDVMLTRPADGSHLAEKIHLLANDESLREKLGYEGRKTYERVATPEHIGQALLAELHSRYSKPAHVELGD